MAKYTLTTLGEDVYMAQALEPQSVSGTVTSSWFKMDKHQFAAFLVNVASGGGTVDVKVRQATDNAGTGAKDVTVASQASAGAGTIWVEFDEDQMDSTNGYQYVALEVTTGAATTLGAVFLGVGDAAPASSSHLVAHYALG